MNEQTKVIIDSDTVTVITVGVPGPPGPGVVPASADAAGIIKIDPEHGDLGGTSESPIVTSTHLLAPLPVQQGGTGAGTTGAALTSLGAASAADLATEISNRSSGDFTNAQAISTKYTKPGSGIPKTDLAAAVVASLNRADTAAQTKTDLGLGSVDNTSDLNKPISTATATALALKAPWPLQPSPAPSRSPAQPTRRTPRTRPTSTSWQPAWKPHPRPAASVASASLLPTTRCRRSTRSAMASSTRSCTPNLGTPASSVWSRESCRSPTPLPPSTTRCTGYTSRSQAPLRR